MKSYLLSVAGMALFTSVCFILIPEGKLKKFIGAILRLCCSLVLLTPIIGFLGDASLETFQTEVSLQQSYLSYCEGVQNDYYCAEIVDFLYREYGLEASVRVETEGGKLQKIFVSFSNSGMSENGTHIHSSSELVEVLKETYGVEVIYEGMA